MFRRLSLALSMLAASGVALVACADDEPSRRGKEEKAKDKPDVSETEETVAVDESPVQEVQFGASEDAEADEATEEPQTAEEAKLPEAAKPFVGHWLGRSKLSKDLDSIWALKNDGTIVAGERKDGKEGSGTFAFVDGTLTITVDTKIQKGKATPAVKPDVYAFLVEWIETGKKMSLRQKVGTELKEANVYQRMDEGTLPSSWK